MKRFDVLGSRDLRPAVVANLVARAVGVEFELHESEYHGGDYYRSKGLEGDEILVQENFKDDEGYLAEPDFGAYTTLIYVNGASEEITRTLVGIDGLDGLRSEAV